MDLLKKTKKIINVFGEIINKNVLDPKKYSEKDLTEEFLLKKIKRLRQKNKTVSMPVDVFNACVKYAFKEVEYFLVLTLNSAHKVVKIHEVSKGTINRTIAHPREIFKTAILDNSESIILCHNHPSGDTTPSREDEAMTEILKQAGEILNIKVLDHVIISRNGFESIIDN